MRHMGRCSNCRSRNPGCGLAGRPDAVWLGDVAMAAFRHALESASGGFTHARRAIPMEAVSMKRLMRKTGRRHECKIAYSWRAARVGGELGATAALFAAVLGAHACGQRPGGTARGTMRFRADSLTHGRRTIFTEGIVVNGLRRKTGARHECKIAYSCPAVGDVEERARRMAESWVPRLRRLQSCRARTAAENVPAGRPGHDAISRAFSYSWDARDFGARHCHERD